MNVFDDYTGPRWTYGLRYRPVGHYQLPAGWIIYSDRAHPDYPRFGTVDFPRELDPAEVAGYELTLVAAPAPADDPALIPFREPPARPMSQRSLRQLAIDARQRATKG